MGFGICVMQPKAYADNFKWRGPVPEMDWLSLHIYGRCFNKFMVYCSGSMDLLTFWSKACAIWPGQNHINVDVLR